MSDLAAELVAQLSILARLLAAGACGALVGLHSEVRQRPGGARTHALTAMGAALFMIPTKTAEGASGPEPHAPTRAAR